MLDYYIPAMGYMMINKIRNGKGEKGYETDEQITEQKRRVKER